MKLSRLLMLGGVIGGLTGLLSIAYLAFLPEAVVTQHITVVLTGAGAIYIGFGLADGKLGSAIIESLVALAFWGIAILGALYSPLILALGFFAHALWDLAHHYKGVNTQVRIWYPPFCAAYDCVIGLFLVSQY